MFAVQKRDLEFRKRPFTFPENFKTLQLKYFKP